MGQCSCGVSAQLDQARKQFDDLRGSKVEAQVSATQLRIKISEQSKDVSFMNGQCEAARVADV